MPPNIQKSGVISRRNFKIVAGTVICVMATIVFALIVIAIVRGSVGVPNRRCFAVDMLEQRVPNWKMPLHRQEGGHLHTARPPLAFGDICFDRQQLVVEWKIKQSFTNLYTLRDLLLRGPQKHKTDKIAPAVLTLGVKISKTNHLIGSTIIEKHLLEDILKNATRYYVSLEGDYSMHEKTSDAAKVQEIARHNLDYAVW